jgi:hypothetical protein
VTPDFGTTSWVGIQEYMTIGLPNMLTMNLEWFSFEFTILVSGYIGVIPQGAHVVF